MFESVDALKSFAIDTLQTKLTGIKCSLGPIFDEMEKLTTGNETAWCNNVGVVYGQMKTKACVDLFKNYEYTNRSLLVIAIFSIFIGFLSIGLNRRINRESNIHDTKAHDFGVEMGFK
jgi:hypothetical protein